MNVKPFQVRVVEPAVLTDRQRACWSRIQETSGEFSSPFFRPEFTDCVAAARNDAAVAVIEREGEPVGFMPFQKAGRGVGQPIGAPLSDMQGVVIPPEFEWNALDVLRPAGLSTWHFDHLLASQAQFAPYHAYVDDSPFIDLSKGFDAFCAARRAAGTRAIAQAQRKRRKFERERGALRFDWHTDSESLLQTLVEWKREQLDKRNYSDLFCRDWVRNLIDSVRRAQSPEFAGVLSSLHAGDELVAIHLGIRCRDVMSSWIPTYNPDYSRYSPGAVLHLDLAMEAARRGVHRIELGRGENQLKVGFRSGGVSVGIGSVDDRLLAKFATRSWYGARKLAYSLPFSHHSIAMYRRIRNAVVAT